MKLLGFGSMSWTKASKLQTALLVGNSEEICSKMENLAGIIPTPFDRKEY